MWSVSCDGALNSGVAIGGCGAHLHNTSWSERDGADEEQLGYRAVLWVAEHDRRDGRRVVARRGGAAASVFGCNVRHQHLFQPDLYRTRAHEFNKLGAPIAGTCRGTFPPHSTPPHPPPHTHTKKKTPDNHRIGSHRIAGGRPARGQLRALQLASLPARCS